MRSVASTAPSSEAMPMSAALPLPSIEAAIRSALGAGRLEDARLLLRQALEIEPQRADLLGMLGQVEHALGAPENALAAFDRALAIAPQAAVLLINRAAVLLASARSADAEADARRAVRLQPEAFGAHLNLGLALEAQQRYREAVPSLEQALSLRPGHPVALAAQARCTFRSEDAHCSVRPLLEAALRHYPDDAELGLMLAESLLSDAEIEASLDVFDAVVRAEPTRPALASARLIALHYDRRTRPIDLLQAARDWARRFTSTADRLPARAPGSPGPRRLRIGWLSPRFAEGPLVELVLPAMEAIAALGVELRLYATHAVANTPAGERFRKLDPGLRDVSGLGDDDLLACLRNDGLDVLIDLAGHAPGNRLAVLSRRAAPLQVSWGDWFGTTGIAAMDLFVSDDFLSPAGSESEFSEILLRLPQGRFCYRPSQSTPVPAPRDEAPLRFVSFNRVSKLSDAVLSVWAEVLRGCTGAHLQLRGGAFDDAAARDHFLQRARRRGLDTARLELIGFRPHAEVLAAYQHADIALDPFPFSGCATSADALWMGVPVVSWPGATLVSRQSGALLRHLDLDDCIAHDAASYVRIALALAADKAHRDRLRTDLRRRITQRLDPAPFAASLVDSLHAQLSRITG